MLPIDRLEQIVSRFQFLEAKLNEDLSGADIAKISREYAELRPVVDEINEYKTLLSALEEAEELVSDPDMKALAEDEVSNLKEKIPKTEQNLQLALLPKDNADARPAILEIRPGTGGDEAALFAGNLLRMYQRYAEINNWSFDMIEQQHTELGGIKEVIAHIKGDGVFARLKYESGVHRVQRVPETESGGRIHTSAATVAVLPEAEDVDIEINSNDLRIDTMRSSGAGGQHVNTTDSAVRITHIATGIVVACQAERSQLQNKTRALELLKTKLLLKKREDELKKLNEIRGDQHEAGWGRQIRSYVLQPYQQVKDARNSIEVGNVQNVLDGDISIFIKEYLKWRRQGIND